MELKDIRALKMLEKIGESDDPLSQRNMSKELNISLGLVNLFIKRLVNKGYVKVTTIPKNRIKYILTPKGAAEKTRLTYAYIKYSFNFYRNIRENLQTLLNDLEQEGVENIIFYGISEITEIAYLIIKDNLFHIVAIVDDDQEGKNFLEYKVQSTKQIDSMDYDRIVITALESHDMAKRQIHALKIPKEKIVEII